MKDSKQLVINFLKKFKFKVDQIMKTIESLMKNIELFSVWKNTEIFKLLNAKIGNGRFYNLKNDRKKKIKKFVNYSVTEFGRDFVFVKSPTGHKFDVLRKNRLCNREALKQVGVKDTFNFFIKHGMENKYSDLLFKNDKLEDFFSHRVNMNESRMTALSGRRNQHICACDATVNTPGIIIHNEPIKTFKTKIKEHIDGLFLFSRNNMVSITKEQVSSSVLSTFGFLAYEFYEIQNIGSRVVSLRKFIRSDGANKFSFNKPGIPDRGICGEGFYKFSVVDENDEESLIYYNNKKLDFIKDGKDLSFFIDGTRKLISVGVDRRQLFTISTKVGGNGFALVYILSRSQTTEHYRKCFKAIQQKTKIFDKCKFVLIDMEIAYANSLRFMKKKSRFCYFHVASRMIKWKSRHDKFSDNENYIRPELITMAQKIIFIPDKSIIYFFSILIWIYVILENNENRRKLSIQFINYCWMYYYKTLKEHRYHEVTCVDLTNNIAESLHAIIRKRVGFVKPIQFIIDFCFLIDFEQMSKKWKNTKKPESTVDFWVTVKKYQSNPTFSRTYGFLFINLLKRKENKIRYYNLKKMFPSFENKEIVYLYERLKNFERDKRVTKLVEYTHTESFMLTGEIKIPEEDNYTKHVKIKLEKIKEECKKEKENSEKSVNYVNYDISNDLKSIIWDSDGTETVDGSNVDNYTRYIYNLHEQNN